MFPRSSHVRTFSAANFSESSRDLVIINRNRHAYYLHNTEGQPLILPRQMQEISFSFLNLASGFFPLKTKLGFFPLIFYAFCYLIKQLLPDILPFRQSNDCIVIIKIKLNF